MSGSGKFGRGMGRGQAKSLNPNGGTVALRKAIPGKEKSQFSVDRRPGGQKIDGGGRGNGVSCHGDPGNATEEAFKLVNSAQASLPPFAMMIRFTPGFLEELRRAQSDGIASSMKFGASPSGNVIKVGNEEFQFSSAPEQGELCGIFEEQRRGEDGNGILAEAGSGWRKISIQRTLCATEKDRVRMRNVEAEKQQKSRKAIVLEHNNSLMKNQASGVGEAMFRRPPLKAKKEPPHKKPKVFTTVVLPAKAKQMPSHPPLPAEKKEKPIFQPVPSITESSSAKTVLTPLQASTMRRIAIEEIPVGTAQAKAGSTIIKEKVPDSSMAGSVEVVGHIKAGGTLHVAEFRNYIISLLTDNPKGMTIKAIEKALGEAMPNCQPGRENILKVVQSIASYQAPGKYVLNQGVQKERSAKRSLGSESSPETILAGSPPLSDCAPVPETAGQEHLLFRGETPPGNPEEAIVTTTEIDLKRSISNKKPVQHGNFSTARKNAVAEEDMFEKNARTGVNVNSMPEYLNNEVQSPEQIGCMDEQVKVREEVRLDSRPVNRYTSNLEVADGEKVSRQHVSDAEKPPPSVPIISGVKTVTSNGSDSSSSTDTGSNSESDSESSDSGSGSASGSGSGSGSESDGSSSSSDEDNMDVEVDITDEEDNEIESSIRHKHKNKDTKSLGSKERELNRPSDKKKQPSQDLVSAPDKSSEDVDIGDAGDIHQFGSNPESVTADTIHISSDIAEDVDDVQRNSLDKLLARQIGLKKSSQGSLTKLEPSSDMGRGNMADLSDSSKSTCLQKEEIRSESMGAERPGSHGKGIVGMSKSLSAGLKGAPGRPKATETGMMTELTSNSKGLETIMATETAQLQHVISDRRNLEVAKPIAVSSNGCPVDNVADSGLLIRKSISGESISTTSASKSPFALGSNRDSRDIDYVHISKNNGAISKSMESREILVRRGEISSKTEEEKDSERKSQSNQEGVAHLKDASAFSCGYTKPLDSSKVLGKSDLGSENLGSKDIDALVKDRRGTEEAGDRTGYAVSSTQKLPTKEYKAPTKQSNCTALPIGTHSDRSLDCTASIKETEAAKPGCMDGGKTLKSFKSGEAAKQGEPKDRGSSNCYEKGHVRNELLRAEPGASAKEHVVERVQSTDEVQKVSDYRGQLSLTGGTISKTSEDEITENFYLESGELREADDDHVNEQMENGDFQNDRSRKKKDNKTVRVSNANKYEGSDVSSRLVGTKGVTNSEAERTKGVENHSSEIKKASPNVEKDHLRSAKRSLDVNVPRAGKLLKKAVGLPQTESLAETEFLPSSKRTVAGRAAKIVPRMDLIKDNTEDGEFNKVDMGDSQALLGDCNMFEASGGKTERKGSLVVNLRQIRSAGPIDAQRKNVPVSPEQDNDKQRGCDGGSEFYLMYEKDKPQLRGPIMSYEQYREYFQEYNEKYPVYLRLNSIIESDKDLFGGLRSEMESAQRMNDKSRLESIAGVVRRNYLHCRKRIKHMRNTFNVLHEELQSIKQQCQDYARSLQNV